MSPKVRISWRAARDGIGHAVVKPSAFNAACGRRAVLERLSWPVTQRCHACEAALRAVGMKLELGVHRVCPACQGAGKRAAMNDDDKRERSRQLRAAKRSKVPPPPAGPFRLRPMRRQGLGLLGPSQGGVDG